MTISEKQMRSLLELKEWLASEIQKHEAKLEKLRDNLNTVNSILRETSFSKASSLRGEEHSNEAATGSQYHGNGNSGSYGKPLTKDQDEESPESSQASSKEESVVPMKSTKGSLIANARIFSDRISIIPLEDVPLDVNTQPFRSFFLKRILGKMEDDDKKAVQEGKIDSSSVMSYSIKKRQENINTDNGNEEEIKEITVYNYRNKERLNEIINTASWSFSKMIENSSAK